MTATDSVQYPMARAPNVATVMRKFSSRNRACTRLRTAFTTTSYPTTSSPIRKTARRTVPSMFQSSTYSNRRPNARNATPVHMRGIR